MKEMFTDKGDMSIDFISNECSSDKNFVSSAIAEQTVYSTIHIGYD